MGKDDLSDLGFEDDETELGEQDFIQTIDTSLEELTDDDPTSVGAGTLPRPAANRASLGGQEVEPLAGTLMAFLQFTHGDQAHPIGPTVLKVSIGRGRGNDLQIATDGEISRNHCRCIRRRDQFWVEDLGSTNGTLVNGELIESARLANGDRLQVGETELEFVFL